MLNKKDFVKAIDDIAKKCKYVFSLEYELSIYMLNHSLIDSYIETLEKAINCKVSERYGSAISWWIFETECGKKDPYIWIECKNKKQKKLKINTSEKLYNYIIKYELNDL